MTALRIAALVAIGFALIVSLWRPSDTGGLIAALEGRTLDARFAIRGKQEPPDNIAILAIDDVTLNALNAFPPPRDALARALDVARDKGASVIAFDLLLNGNGQGDEALVQALAQADDTIMAISLSQTLKFENKAPLQEAIARSSLSFVVGAPMIEPLGNLGPTPEFAARTSLGHVNIAREVDGALRRILLANQAGDGFILPALPLEAVRHHGGLDRSAVSLIWGEAMRVRGETIALDQQNEVGLNFYGPRGSIPTYSLIDAQQAALKGRMVFIGATAKGFGDTFPTAFDRDMPGVEALATMAANITEGTTLRRDNLTWLFDMMFATAAAIAGVWAASRAQPAKAIALTVLVWGAALALLQYAFLRALWLDGAVLILSLLVATVSGGAARWLMHRNSARNLSRYQSPLLAQVLADTTHPIFDGREQKAAALFVDAVDFTARTARLGSVRTAQFLKAFHQCIETAASAHSGIVEQYAGDGAMICFGLPEPKPEDARNALNCAEQLFVEIQSLSEAEIQAGEQSVFIRIGAHYGDVSAAVLGGKNHSHVTFVGDVINAASRLQDVAKELKAELVVSNDLVEASGGSNHSGLSFHGPKHLRGRGQPLDIWLRPQKDQS